jgi:hypothetical protein
VPPITSREASTDLKAIQEMVHFKRLFVACAVLFLAGCSRPMCSYAAYENWTIAFEGEDGVISKVRWSPGRDNPSCPLVVHLDGNDLDNAKFASTTTMRSLGARSFDDKDDFGLSLDKPDVAISCTYRNGKLQSVTVNLLNRPHGKASLTVNGKDVSLPIEEDKLFEILGKPHYFSKIRRSI